MEVNFLKFQTFLAKMYRIENLTYENRRGNLAFLFVEESVSYSYGLEKMKECEYHFGVKP